MMSTVRILTATCILGAATAAQAEPLDVEYGDHIAIVGNTLAERMQHDGWLETAVQALHPEEHLVFRNLGFSGDELTTRLRSSNFGSPDDWLQRVEADVVAAFFGYNESYAGPDGEDQFRNDLANYVRHVTSQKYDGQSTAQIVLFSPIAHENLNDPDLPDGSENNARLAAYTKIMRGVAEDAGVTFVDLYTPTLAAYEQHDEPLTINGVHLNSKGNQVVAEIILRDMLGITPDQLSWQAWEPVRQAVLDKNFYWFNRYRTTDGYSIYGGRADLKFVDNQTNRVVMQREMEVLDTMTANRDPHIWAVALGQSHTVDDGNTPPFIPVETNKPGAGPNGTHLFLTGEEAIDKMKVGEGMQVNLFASEEQFPELASPVQMAFDTRGRCWVAAWPTYPHWKPKEEMNDKLLIFEDTDGDGQADECKVFADKLHNPTGFEFWGGGVIVAMAPDLLFLKDTDGDDVADVRTRILHGIDSADTHHTINSFVLGPDGALYFQEGTFHHTQVETPWEAPVRSANAGVFRFEPKTSQFDVFVAYGFANPHGHVFDRWGQDFVTDGTGAVNYLAAAFSGHLDFPKKHRRLQPWFKQRTRPCPATEILSSRHFPEESFNNFLIGNVIGVQGILQYRFEDDGSGFKGIEVEPIVTSSDPNFRPADLEVAPDGSLYFIDWQNPIIGHMQHNLRDPSRDRIHGRVYRVTYPSRPLLDPPAVAGEPIATLLDLLKTPEDRLRYRVRIELSGRPTEEVISAAQTWINDLDETADDFEHHRLEGLWLHQQHNVVNVDLLRTVLRSSDYRARAAATRVLCYWRDRVPAPLDLLMEQANDEHPRVRLEAVRAASFFRDPKAEEVAVSILAYDMDPYLEYTLNETLTQLEGIKQ